MILENATELDTKTRNRLSRMKTMLQEKSKQVSDPAKRIVSICKLEEIKKEIVEANMRVMGAIANILLTKMSLNANTNFTTPGGSVAQFSDDNASTLTGSLAMPPSNQTLQTRGSSTPNDSLATPPSNKTLQTTGSPPAYPPPPNQNSPMTGRPSATCKLPKLTQPKFRGRVMQLESFWNTFESAIHSNLTSTNIAKFNYLVTQLEGATSCAIAGLLITKDNYKAAVDILIKRLGKPQQIIASHMGELLKILVCSSERPSQLLYLYDKIRVNVRGLEALGIKSTQYEHNIPVVMAKLPPDI